MLLRSPLFLPALILAGSAALLLGAWGFELIGGLLPCKLCLQQRVPHYLLAALIIPAIVLVRFRPFRLIFFVAASGLIAAAAFLAAKHVGVEFGWWQGPMDCGGRVQTHRFCGRAVFAGTAGLLQADLHPAWDYHGDVAPACRAAAAGTEPARAVALGSGAAGPTGGITSPEP